jgi:hypothetical protein
VIAEAERRRMLAVPLCGSRVLARLEAIGVERLTDLAGRDPEELVLAVNASVGWPIWRRPMAHRAMANLIAAAERMTGRRGGPICAGPPLDAPGRCDPSGGSPRAAAPAGRERR